MVNGLHVYLFCLAGAHLAEVEQSHLKFDRRTALLEAVAARLIACQKRRYALRRDSEDAPVRAIGPAFQAASWLVAQQPPDRTITTRILSSEAVQQHPGDSTCPCARY